LIFKIRKIASNKAEQQDPKAKHICQMDILNAYLSEFGRPIILSSTLDNQDIAFLISGVKICNLELKLATDQDVLRL